MRHEPLFPISTLPRAPARTGKRRPILPAATGRRRNRSLLPLTNDGPSPSSATHVTDRERRSAALPQPPPASAHSNHISVRRRSGFLHVAVSKAPTSQPSVRDQSVMWALQIQPMYDSLSFCQGLEPRIGRRKFRGGRGGVKGAVLWRSSRPLTPSRPLRQSTWEQSSDVFSELCSISENRLAWLNDLSSHVDESLSMATVQVPPTMYSVR